MRHTLFSFYDQPNLANNFFSEYQPSFYNVSMETDAALSVCNKTDRRTTRERCVFEYTVTGFIPWVLDLLDEASGSALEANGESIYTGRNNRSGWSRLLLLRGP